MATIDKPPVIQSSKRDLTEFSNTLAWRDVCAYIEYRMQGNYNILKSELDHRALLRSQGAIEVAENILQLPDELIELLEADEQLNEDNRG